MPQLVKGGKYVFGWSKLDADYNLRIPPETCEEYRFTSENKVIIISGSLKSGGFSAVKTSVLKNSQLSSIFTEIPKLFSFDLLKGEVIVHGNRCYCWTIIQKDCLLKLQKETLERYGIFRDENLLVVRGSNLSSSFITKGPIYKQALKHEEILQY